MTRRKKFLGIFVIGVSLFIAGCQPEPEPWKLYDDLVVATNFDPDADFGDYTTFAIPEDTIGLISNTTDDTIWVNDYASDVLDEIRSNFVSKGFSRVDKNANPDLGVNVLVIHGYNVIQEVVYPDPYLNGGGYYSGYYGYNSWYYYPYVNTYAYNNAVLVIELVDLKNKMPENKVKIVWDAYIGDLTTTGDSITEQSVRGIKQAFVQSDYLGD